MSVRTEIEKLEELIKGKIAGEVVEQKVESLVPPGENFGSVIFKVDVKVKNGEETSIYHFVAKCTPPNKVTQELFNIQVTTKAEIGWYTTIIPTIREFQREHGVEQVADFFQTFYGSRISLDPKSDIVDLDSVILTENLIPLGYKNIDRHLGFDLKTSKAILRDLATFHAVPIAIKLNNKEIFDRNIRPHLPGLQFKDDPSMKDKFKPIKDGLSEISELAPYMDRFVVYVEKNKSQLQTSPTVREPWGSISHNDFWINNIMVTEGNSPKTIFLDFQFCSYGSIVTDVLFFLVVSVDLEVIAESMDELIKYYWDEFIKNLKNYNIDDTLFTFEEFLKEIDKIASAGLLMRALFHTFIILTDKGHSDFDSSDENFTKKDFDKFNFSLNNKHKEKYRWLVLEFVKRGWL